MAKMDIQYHKYTVLNVKIQPAICICEKGISFHLVATCFVHQSCIKYELQGQIWGFVFSHAAVIEATGPPMNHIKEELEVPISSCADL